MDEASGLCCSIGSITYTNASGVLACCTKAEQEACGENETFNPTTCECDCNNDKCAEGSVCCPNGTPHCVTNGTQSVCCEMEGVDIYQDKADVWQCCTSEAPNAVEATGGVESVYCCENETDKAYWNGSEYACCGEGNHVYETAESGVYACCSGEVCGNVCCESGSTTPECIDEAHNVCCGTEGVDVYQDKDDEWQCCTSEAPYAVEINGEAGEKFCCENATDKAYWNGSEYACCSEGNHVYETSESGVYACCSGEVCGNVCCEAGSVTPECRDDGTGLCCDNEKGEVYEDASGAQHCCPEGRPNAVEATGGP